MSLTANWSRVPFDEAVEDVTRGHAKTKQRNYLEKGKYPIVDQGKDLIGGYTDDESKLSDASLPVVIFGDHTRCVKFIDFPFGVGADGVKILRPRRGIDPKFLYYFLRSLPMHNAGYSRHFKYLRESEIPVPPLDEQRRITAVLDAADSMVTLRRRAMAMLQTLIRSIFIDMFGGGGRPPVVPNPTDGGHPKGWSWVPVLDKAKMGTGHTPDRAVPEYWGGDISWINLNEIRGLDGKLCTATTEKVTPAGVANSSAVVHPAGTVCFSRTASIGYVTIMATPMTTSQDFVTWTCGADLNPEFLMHALVMSRETLQASSSGSTHKTIYVRDAERFSILLPPRSLQDDFIQRVHTARQAADRMLTQAAAMDGLAAALEQRAFRGEL